MAIQFTRPSNFSCCASFKNKPRKNGAISGSNGERIFARKSAEGVTYGMVRVPVVESTRTTVVQNTKSMNVIVRNILVFENFGDSVSGEG